MVGLQNTDPKSRLIVFRDADIIPQEEYPVAFTEAVMNFCQNPAKHLGRRALVVHSSRPDLPPRRADAPNLESSTVDEGIAPEKEMPTDGKRRFSSPACRSCSVSQ